MVRNCLALACLLLWMVVEARPSHANTDIVLQLRWKHQAQFIGYYVAKHKGFYQAKGLNVTIKPGGAGIIPWKEVIEGHADYAVDNTNVLTAYRKGQNLKALAAIYQHSPSAFLAKADSGIRGLSDLKGKRIMVFPDNQDPELMALLHAGGVLRGGTELIPTSADINDLLEGRVDAFNAYLSNEPYFLTQQRVPYVIIKPIDFGVDFYSDILITAGHRVADSPSEVEVFRKASLEGWRYALTNQSEALDIMERHYEVEKSRDHSRFELRLVSQMIMPEFIQIGHMNPDRWRNIAEHLRNVGLIDSIGDIESFLYHPPGELNLKQWTPWIAAAGVIVVFTIIMVILLSAKNRTLVVEIRRRRQTEQKLRHMMKHDPMTGLPNRVMLYEQVERCVAQAKEKRIIPGLIFIDLDGFKAINDQFGHAAGDLILKAFAQRAAAIVRKSEMVARLAGDEFVILVTDTSQGSLELMTKRIQECTYDPINVEGGVARVGASVGAVTYSDQDESCEAFIHRADQEMYKMKQKRKNKEPPTLERRSN